MVHTAVVFDHRGRAGKDKEAPIEIRVTVARKPYYINTGVHVYAREWKYGMIVDRHDAEELNERIAIIGRKVEQIINQFIRNSRDIDVAAIRRMIYEKTGNSNAFLNWMEKQVGMLSLAKGTIKHYRTLLTRLEQFGEFVTWEDVTAENIKKFDFWLHSQKKPLSRNQKVLGMEAETLSDACVWNYHKDFKKMLGLAEKFGVIDRNPYTRLKGEFSRGHKDNVEYLTEEEMRAIVDLKLRQGSELATARDMFVIQMYTGMAYTDLTKFSIDNYKKVGDAWVSIEQRVKTGVAFVGHLLSPVVEVLERYNMQVPMMANQPYNRTLKRIGEMAGIKTRLHSHLARHTFGTYMLANGVKIENLQRMMGHKKIEMTQRYAIVLAENVHDDFDMIDKKLRHVANS